MLILHKFNSLIMVKKLSKKIKLIIKRMFTK